MSTQQTQQAVRELRAEVVVLGRYLGHVGDALAKLADSMQAEEAVRAPVTQAPTTQAPQFAPVPPEPPVAPAQRPSLLPTPTQMPLPAAPAGVTPHLVFRAPLPSPPQAGLRGPAAEVVLPWTQPPRELRVRPARKRRAVSLAEVFAIVGAAVTLIGVALVLMLPQDGLLGWVARTAIALTLAAAAYGVAVWQRRVDVDNLGAQALMATAIASTFLCIIALTLVFTGSDGAAIVPTLPGLVIAGAVSAGGLLVARSWNSQWLAVLAVLGTLLLAPALSRSMLDAMWALAFMIVMTVATGPIQRGKGWTVLLLARVLPTGIHFLSVAAATLAFTSSDDVTSIGIALAALLAAASLPLAVLHQEGKQPEASLGVAAMVLLSSPLMLIAWSGDWLPAALACLSVGLFFTVAGALGKRIGTLVATAAVPLGATLLTFAALVAFDGRYQGFLWWGMALAYLAVSERSRSKVVAIVGVVFTGIGLFQWLDQAPILVWASEVYRLAPAGVERVVESLLGLAVVIVLLRVQKAFGVGPRTVAWYAAWAGALVFESAALVLAGTLIGYASAQSLTGFQTAHGVLTVTWMVLCVAQLARGLRRAEDARNAVRLAAALAGAAVLKLFLFDLATLPGLVRALAFLGVGVLLLVVGTWYYRQLARVRRDSGDDQPPTHAPTLGTPTLAMPTLAMPTLDAPAPAERTGAAPATAGAASRAGEDQASSARSSNSRTSSGSTTSGRVTSTSGSSHLTP